MKRRPGKDHADDRSAHGYRDPDAEDFARAMADVVRLPPDPRTRVRNAQPIGVPRAPAAPTAPSPTRDDADHEARFAAPGVDRRELRRLRRGEHAAARRLDLHGMTAPTAVARVRRFIDEGRRQGHRCVCVVHGRGLHSDGKVSILKTRVRELLRQHGAVLAYADAPPGDGGNGAVYVLLRK
jgi:DNA-nicking Smr family endonuclease